MKIRDGFVSNSSSSSFVLVVPKVYHDEAVATLTPEQQKQMKKVKPKRGYVGDVEVVMIEGYSCEDVSQIGDLSLEWDENIDGGFDEGFFEAYAKVLEKKYKKKYIYQSDCH
jgi:hypothetical protein